VHGKEEQNPKANSSKNQIHYPLKTNNYSTKSIAKDGSSLFHVGSWLSLYSNSVFDRRSQDHSKPWLSGPENGIIFDACFSEDNYQ